MPKTEYNNEKNHTRYNYLQIKCVAKEPLNDLPEAIEKIKFDYCFEKGRKEK